MTWWPDEFGPNGHCYCSTVDQMQPSPTSQLGIDDLENVELIGSGGSAQVYRATQVSFEREVAVKILNQADDQLNRRFDRERRAMGKLSSHTGIVPVYTSGTNNFGQPYLIMPFYARGSLADEIARQPMPWPQAVDHMAAVASTIGHAHQNGVLHLDLKPGNVMVADDGTPRVADFGIAKLLTDQTSGSATNTSFTPAYCPPEILSGQAPSSAADIYGLGSTLWALIAGRPPFHTDEASANSIVAVMGRVANEPPADLRDRAPDWVCRIIEQAMSKDPAQRYANGEDMAVALRAGATDPAANLAAGLAADQQATITAPSGAFAPPSTHTQPVGPPVHDPLAAAQTPYNPTSDTPTSNNLAEVPVATPAGVAAYNAGPSRSKASSPVGLALIGMVALLVIGGLAAAFIVSRGGDDGSDVASATGTSSDDLSNTATDANDASGTDSTSTTEQATSTEAPTTEAPTTTRAPTTEAPVTSPTTAQPSSSVPAEDLVGTSLAGRHGITLQWISFESDDWGAIEFEPLGDERYQVSGRQDGPAGDYVTVEGTMTKISDLELQFEGTVVVQVTYLNGGEPCTREGQMTFLSTQNRQYWRMQNFQSPCDTQADYVDIYF